MNSSSPALRSLAQLADAIDAELRAYPYPITACDVVFKLLAEQRGHCRVALIGLAGTDGLDHRDALEALTALLATPLVLSVAERSALQVLADELAIGETV